MRHLIDPNDLTARELDEIIDLALDIIDNRGKYAEACKGRKLATLFYEPSTRTRLSFTSAMMELGGNVIGFSDAMSSSVSKGETVADTTRVINCFADIIAMRHNVEGAPLVPALNSRTPVINAGDGSHAHPTQTLTDLLTIKREIGHFDNLTIGFCGDLKFGRTVHSLIKALSKFKGVNVVLIAPDELKLPGYMKHEVCDKLGVPYREVQSLEEVIDDLDVLYMTRVQKERFLDEDEYNRVKDCFVLTADKLRNAKPTMRILHPLPRVNEVVRMALILKLLEWAEDPSQSRDLIGADAIRGGHRCSNPKCISNTESHAVEPIFRPSADGNGLRCLYCESRPAD